MTAHTREVMHVITNGNILRNWFMNGAEPEKIHFLSEMSDFITQRLRETGS
jgi:hypothetical protein